MTSTILTHRVVEDARRVRYLAGFRDRYKELSGCRVSAGESPSCAVRDIARSEIVYVIDRPELSYAEKLCLIAEDK